MITNTCIYIKMSVNQEYLEKIMSKIAITLQLKDWQYNVRKFENMAQNYFGVLIPVLLRGKGTEDVAFPMVIKLAPTDERFRVSGAVTLFFAKEIFVYTKILYEYRDIQRNIPSPLQFVIPKCYYVCTDYCNEVIGIQNMCEENYKPYVSDMFLDIDHITVALESLAKFHALSYIFKETNTMLYEEAKDFCIPLSVKTNKRFIDILLDRLKKALVKFENTNYTKQLESLYDNCSYIIESAFDSVKSVCLCHGDIWKENILFNYENNVPVSACIIDYQTVRMCSPAFDVLFLIITSTTSALRKIFFKELLCTYYQTFVQILKSANLNSEIIYSRKMLDCDLQIVGRTCFIIANTAIWLASGLQEEGHVRSKIKFDTEEEKLNAVKQYKDIISGIIDDLLEYGFLNCIV